MWLTRLLHKLRDLFLRRKLTIALYGPPNGGKTTLANRICADWLGEEMGSVSRIAHETRKVQLKQGVRVLSANGKSLTFSLADTPGLASRIDYEDFVASGMDEESAKMRAREAAQGVLEGIEWMAQARCILIVLDATKEPHNQVNSVLVDAIAERGIVSLIVANKIDLKKANVDRVRIAFPTHEVIGVSAKYGDNMDLFYEKLFDLAGKVD